MSPSIESQILAAEEKLRLAMLHSDVNSLDELLAPELIFTNHLGQILHKQDDLSAHQSGSLTINELTPSEQQIQLNGNVAIVSVRMHLAGSYAGVTSEGDFRFTRVWSLSPRNAWRVIAAHSTVIA
ncbi:MAG: nuclear transport factor 2 family protein [Leptolyngbya sp. SIO1D8]|nr:nuclear transport factor 2 family protein [Leptolyngbya sp. SIO1D8]